MKYILAFSCVRYFGKVMRTNEGFVSAVYILLLDLQNLNICLILFLYLANQ